MTSFTYVMVQAWTWLRHCKVAPRAISVKLQNDLEETSTWSSNNKMVLIDTKTKSMLVTRKRLESKLDTCLLNLQLNGPKLEQVNVKNC